MHASGQPNAQDTPSWFSSGAADPSFDFRESGTIKLILPVQSASSPLAIRRSVYIFKRLQTSSPPSKALPRHLLAHVSSHLASLPAYRTAGRWSTLSGSRPMSRPPQQSSTRLKESFSGVSSFRQPKDWRVSRECYDVLLASCKNMTNLTRGCHHVRVREAPNSNRNTAYVVRPVLRTI